MRTAGVDDPIQSARDVSRRAAHSTWLGYVARVGIVAKGVSFGLVGVLACAVALADLGSATSREGALAIVAGESYGVFLIAALAFGFACYTLWRLVEAIFDRAHEGDRVKGLAKRAGYLGRAAIYGVLTFIAVQLLDGRNESGQEVVEERKVTARVLEWPAGRWLVALAGVALIGAGLFNAYRAFTQKFEEKWATGEMQEAERRWLPRVSSLGLFARFVIFALIGTFLLKAAYQYDPQEAIGLDGALRTLVQTSYGPVLLFVLAAGLVCYALFCFVEARYRRV